MQETTREASEALAQEVGERLRDRRTKLSLTLRKVADEAGISAAHLSDIENGRSHASLPVLLRIGRALDLPLTHLLPRLGGHHVMEGSLGSSPGETVLSHPKLRLVVRNVNLRPEDGHRIAVGSDEDVLIFVIEGRCTIDVDGAGYLVSARDCMDVERATSIHITALADSRLLVCRGTRR